MTQKEVTAVLAIIKVAFPSFCKDGAIDQTIILWSEMFKDENAIVVTEAVKSLIATSKFPPTIADVKEKIQLVTQPQGMTEMEAWEKVLLAVRDSYYHAQEQFDRLPSIIQRVVGSPSQLKEWSTMDSEVVNSVIQSNFMRSYAAKIRQEKEFRMLPLSTQEVIKGLSDRLSLGEPKLVSEIGEYHAKGT